jgi:hypothetical protein
LSSYKNVMATLGSTAACVGYIIDCCTVCVWAVCTSVMLCVTHSSAWQCVGRAVVGDGDVIYSDNSRSINTCKVHSSFVGLATPSRDGE